MSAAAAPTPWPAVAPDSALRFGRACKGGAGPADGLQWVLLRNCSLSPRQLASFYASICAVSLLIALGFAFNGAPVVLAFAGLELLVLGAALLVYARHARDGDTLTLAGQELSVEQAQGGVTQRTLFRAEWVRVEPAHGYGSLVELSGQGLRVRVGRFLRAEMRDALADELRRALRSARSVHGPASVDPV